MDFQSGERVIHQDRPEWGVGVVLSAQTGGDGQRLRVRFERAGLKTLSVPPAAVEHQAKNLNGALTPSDRLAGLDEHDAAEVMTGLPEAARDPFTSVAARLAATLSLYRFEPTGASIIDWAASQSGLADPLSRFTRHELEALFRTFERRRDAHLKRLADDVRNLAPADLAAAVADAPPAGKRALSRLIGR